MQKAGLSQHEFASTIVSWAASTAWDVNNLPNALFQDPLSPYAGILIEDLDKDDEALSFAAALNGNQNAQFHVAENLKLSPAQRDKAQQRIKGTANKLRSKIANIETGRNELPSYLGNFLVELWKERISESSLEGEDPSNESISTPPAERFFPNLPGTEAYDLGMIPCDLMAEQLGSLPKVNVYCRPWDGALDLIPKYKTENLRTDLWPRFAYGESITFAKIPLRLCRNTLTLAISPWGEANYWIPFEAKSQWHLRNPGNDDDVHEVTADWTIIGAAVHREYTSTMYSAGANPFEY